MAAVWTASSALTAFIVSYWLVFYSGVCLACVTARRLAVSSCKTMRTSSEKRPSIRPIDHAARDYFLPKVKLRWDEASDESWHSEHLREGFGGTAQLRKVRGGYCGHGVLFGEG